MKNYVIRINGDEYWIQAATDDGMYRLLRDLVLTHYTVDTNDVDKHIEEGAIIDVLEEIYGDSVIASVHR